MKMVSKLIVLPVQKIQSEIAKIIKSKKIPCIYISLNKTRKNAEDFLNSLGISTEKVFFIDCVSSEKELEDSISVNPKELEKLEYVISQFISQIKENKFVLIDSLATLLIYNSETKVAQLTKSLTENSSAQNFELIAISQDTAGEQLLNNIYNFFDEVIK